ncbi:N-acetylglucosamine-6-phosphate deacetylase [Lentilactobacillus sp. SPB1-3]|uniref:N-acetylglucosamine-6-phosphate deacetylase n=1 Tax=Lentilactobacillus terminaliae TaxID=3003483 RepID=A0ACD5DG64_9LACO|nr:N-acetylglucosamine-6-phosphate deacetylase [Lentilactobacillus sp. SPB1-3]MCZ0976862.1 N-acetylglucosamine-6-phosphate deacetylase [Lentilactobacillus sp. SPB1-3]
MTNVIVNARIIDGQSDIESGYLRFDERILASGPMKKFVAADDDQIIDYHGKIVIPGFIDMHCHAGYGIDSMTGSTEELTKLASQLAQEGVTGVLLTTMTQSDQAISKALESIAVASNQATNILGIHLEGPFVSKAFHGAQPADEVKDFDLELMKSWQEIAGDHIKAITYAPELPNARELERYCEEHAILRSMGHSQATYDQANSANADRITHLYNAQSPLHHRNVGLVGEAFLNPSLMAELIVDGVHVSPAAVKIAYQAVGTDRLELVTDSMEARGMPDGDYQLGGQKVIVSNGAARLEDGTLAGSVLKFKDAFKNVVEFTNCSLLDAVKMSSTNQARELGLTDQGNFNQDSYANINIFDNDLDLRQTYYRGTPLNRR